MCFLHFKNLKKSVIKKILDNDTRKKNEGYRNI
jgi:hypothetical protein